MPRDRQPEWMDDPSLRENEHVAALVGLRRLNRISGIARPMFRHIKHFADRVPNRPLRVLDVASGHGDVPMAWLTMAKRRGMSLHLTLVDISPRAIDQQRRLANRLGVDVASIQRDCLHDGLPSGFDVVTCSLFMHHLDSAQAGRLLQNMQQASLCGMIVSDLHRSRTNLALVWLGSRLVTRSSVVHHDATASVRAAFTCSEFVQLAERSLARPVKHHYVLPAQFIVTFDEQACPVLTPAFA